MPLTSLSPEARPTTRARCLGSIALASMTLLAIAPVEAQSRVSAAPSDATSEASIIPFRTQAPVRAGSSPLDRAVTLELRDLTLDRALREIDRQANLGLTYTQRVVPVERRVTVVAKDVSAREALRRVLAGTGVTAELTEAGTVILVRAPQPAPAAVPAAAVDTVNVGAIAGVVRGDSGGTRLAGATVVLAEGGRVRAQTQTSRFGTYSFHGVPFGDYVVTARMVGYLPQRQRVSVDTSPATRVDFVLQKREVRLDQVVVTATGERRRVELGSDITVIDVAKVMEERPVTNIADLLEGRVPGLEVQRSSGAPGDPSRLRIRGQSSIHRGNDPIFIVDGIRVYAEQSDERNRSLAGLVGRGPANGYATPSPIDNIDPGSIEKIEVLKGPSAATLYGADAANGVIVITSKRGRPGPPRWNVSMERGTSTLPGRFPEGMAHWGHNPMAPEAPILCGAFAPGCVTDSIVTFQALNDPDLTIIDRGERSMVRLGVSGGSQSYSYSLSGSYRDDLGMVRLPQLEVARFEQRTGKAAPDWMQRPQAMKRWSLSSRITTDVGERANASLTTSISQSEQRRSSLEARLSGLMTTYVDRASGKYYGVSSAMNPTARPSLLDDFMDRATAGSLSFTTGLNVTWRARNWLTTAMDAGVDVTDRDDEVLLTRGMSDVLVASSRRDTSGRVAVGRGRSLQSTLNARATMHRSLPHRWWMDLSVGANYTGRSTADITISGTDLPAGSSSIAKAGQIQQPKENAGEMATFGFFVEPAINHRRILYISTGVRVDGGSTYGSSVTMPVFPKVSVSYLLSEESFFPFKDHIGSLRLRAAYGHSNVQPGPSDRLRLYSDERAWHNGALGPGAMVWTLGNTELRPERAVEIEAGFEAGLLDDRVSVSVSGYRKTQVDALMQVPVPPSVYGGGFILRNVGVIRNTGREMELSAEVLRNDALSWSMTLNVSQNRNRVVELGRGVEPFYATNGRVVAGYPLGGRWVQPIVGYSDRDGDGRITPGEVLVGDTLVYIGTSDPDYTAGLRSTLSLFRRALTLSAGLQYHDDLTQEGAWGRLTAFSPAYADPNAPLDAQAAIVGLLDPKASQKSTYWNYQTISTLRLANLAVQWNAPRAWAERAGARALSVALRGENLGLRTGGYRGLDPHVNSYFTGNVVSDAGVIPQPRSWVLAVSAQY